jgi:hypothetical protein
MSKRNTALIAALSMIAAATVFTSQVQAGGASSAAMKNSSHAVQMANNGQNDQIEITQFTSSSAPRHHHRHYHH